MLFPCLVAEAGATPIPLSVQRWNIYKLMLNFGKLYDIISDEEKKNLITYLIKEIQIYPNGESELPLKSIEFNFPIYRDGQEVRRLLWEKGNTVESICLLERVSN